MSADTPIARLAEHLRRYYSSHLVRRKARKERAKPTPEATSEAQLGLDLEDVP